MLRKRIEFVSILPKVKLQISSKVSDIEYYKCNKTEKILVEHIVLYCTEFNKFLSSNTKALGGEVELSNLS